MLMQKAAGQPLLYKDDPSRLQRHQEQFSMLRRQGLTERELLKQFALTANRERPEDVSGDLNND